MAETNNIFRLMNKITYLGFTQIHTKFKYAKTICRKYFWRAGNISLVNKKIRNANLFEKSYFSLSTLYNCLSERVLRPRFSNFEQQYLLYFPWCQFLSHTLKCRYETETVLKIGILFWRHLYTHLRFIRHYIIT